MESIADPELLTIFRDAFKMKRRLFAKTLMGAGKFSDARDQLWASLGRPIVSASAAKSLGLLVASYLPKALQPAWPPVYRDIRGPA